MEIHSRLNLKNANGINLILIGCGNEIREIFFSSDSYIPTSDNVATIKRHITNTSKWVLQFFLYKGCVCETLSCINMMTNMIIVINWCININVNIRVLC